MVDRNAETLIDYYTKAIEEDPENRWPVFWLAQSFHLKQDYDAAIPLYEKAIKMGVTARFAGFYLGDAFARVGQHKQAAIWYEKVLDSKMPSYPMLYADHKNRVGLHGSVQGWAAFRLKWSLVTQAGGADLSGEPLKRFRKMHPQSVVEGPNFSSIAHSLCTSKHSTLEKIRESIERHAKLHDKLNDTQMEKISPVLDALASGQPYVEAADDRPLYLSFENKEKVLFQHFERRHLHFRYRNFYERLVNYE